MSTFLKNSNFAHRGEKSFKILFVVHDCKKLYGSYKLVPCEYINFFPYFSDGSDEERTPPDPCEQSKEGKDVNRRTLEDKAKQNYSEGKFKEALECYNEAIEKTQDKDSIRSRLYRNRGMCHRKLRDWKAAEADHLKAVELQPNDFIAQLLLSLTSIHVGSYDIVIENSEKAIEFLSNNPVMAAMRKDFSKLIEQARFLKTGFDPCVNDEKVVGFLGMGIGGTPVITAEFIMERGEMFDDENDYDKAIQCYDKAIEVAKKRKEKDMGKYYVARGLCYMDQEQWQTAEKDFKEAVKLDRKNLYFKVLLGHAAFQCKQYDLVIDTMEQAKKILDKKKDLETPEVIRDQISKLLAKARNPQGDIIELYKTYLFALRELNAEKSPTETYG